MNHGIDSVRKSYQVNSTTSSISQIQQTNAVQHHITNQHPGFPHVQSSSANVSSTAVTTTDSLQHQNPFTLSLPTTSATPFFQNARMQQQYIQMCRNTLFSQGGVASEQPDNNTVQVIRNYAEMFHFLGNFCFLLLKLKLIFSYRENKSKNKNTRIRSFTYPQPLP